MISVAKTYKTYNFGGTGDCGFRSIAGSLLALFFTRQLDSLFQQGQYNQLLNDYFQYYPQHKPQDFNRLNAQQLMAHLIESVPLNQLVVSLGYTIRQLAVSAIIEKPGIYRGPFVEKHEGTSPEGMRKMSTYIDETVIAAVANEVLNLPIEVKYQNTPQSVHYNKTSNGPKIVLDLNGAHYTARIARPEIFQQPSFQQSSENTSSIVPREVNQRDPSLPEIIERQQRYDRKVLAKLKYHENRLEKFSLQYLLNKFFEFKAGSDYLSGYAKTKGNGSPLFKVLYSLIEKNASKREIQPYLENASIQKELAHALAQSIAIGHVPSNAIPSPVSQSSQRLLGNSKPCKQEVRQNNDTDESHQIEISV